MRVSLVCPSFVISSQFEYSLHVVRSVSCILAILRTQFSCLYCLLHVYHLRPLLYPYAIKYICQYHVAFGRSFRTSFISQAFLRSYISFALSLSQFVEVDNLYYIIPYPISLWVYYMPLRRFLRRPRATTLAIFTSRTSL